MNQKQKTVKDVRKGVVGVFPMAADLLHAGHVYALELAKRHCDYLIVVLNCAPNKNRPEKRAPVQSIFERFWQVRAVKWVDEIIPYEGEEDLITCLAILKYDLRFLGSDYKNKEWTGKAMEAERGIKPVFAEREWNARSSTELIERIKKAHAEKK